MYLLEGMESCHVLRKKHIQTNCKGKQNLFHAFLYVIPYAWTVLFLDEHTISEIQLEIISVF